LKDNVIDKDNQIILNKSVIEDFGNMKDNIEELNDENQVIIQGGKILDVDQ